MIIYQVIEVQTRELDSRLLTSVIAASRGHTVVNADARTLFRIAARNAIPGVFHDKSVTPSESRLRRHQLLKREGFIVTAQDEEHGMLRKDLQTFVDARFSTEALETIDIFFCWGQRDFEFLRQRFPEHCAKFRETGSPRADFWKPPLSQRILPNPQRPRIVIVSNFGINSFERHWELVEKKRRLGMYERSASMNPRATLKSLADELWLLGEFCELVETLARELPHAEITVRPHPIEDPKSWKSLLSPLPNVVVDKYGEISDAISDAAFVVHHGCTTGFQAITAGIPLISFMPDGFSLNGSLSNNLGFAAKSSEEVLNLAKAILANQELQVRTPKFFRESLRSDEEFAAARLIYSWEAEGMQRGLSNFRVGFPPKLRIRGLRARILHKQGTNFEFSKYPGVTANHLNERVKTISSLIGAPPPKVQQISSRVHMISPAN